MQVRLLLRQGADINHEDYDGRTVLHRAAAQGNVKVSPFAHTFKWAKPSHSYIHAHTNLHVLHRAAAQGNVKVSPCAHACAFVT